VTFLPRRQQEAQQRIRADQATDAWRRGYALRYGIECLIAQASRRSDLHHARYRGLAKTHLQHVLTALALNWSASMPGLPGPQRPAAGPPDSPGWPNPYQQPEFASRVKSQGGSCSSARSVLAAGRPSLTAAPAGVEVSGSDFATSIRAADRPSRRGRPHRLRGGGGGLRQRAAR
jgi:Transposase DDE domain